MNTCKNCGKLKAEFEDLWIEVQLIKTGPPCLECREQPTKRAWYDFCCPECFVEYVTNTGFVDEIDRIDK